MENQGGRMLYFSSSQCSIKTVFSRTYLSAPYLYIIIFFSFILSNICEIAIYICWLFFINHIKIKF